MADIRAVSISGWIRIELFYLGQNLGFLGSCECTDCRLLLYEIFFLQCQQLNIPHSMHQNDRNSFSSPSPRQRHSYFLVAHPSHISSSIRTTTKTQIYLTFFAHSCIIIVFVNKNHTRFLSIPIPETMKLFQVRS